MPPKLDLTPEERKARKKAQYKRWRDAHIEQEHARLKAYRATHVDEIHAYNVQHYAEHKDDYHLKHVLYYAIHQERLCAYSREYYATHKEARAAYHARYNATHKAKRHAYNALYYARHKAHLRLRVRAYLLAHPGYSTASKRAWMARNAAHVQAYHARPESRLARLVKCARYRARKAGFPDTFTAVDHASMRQYFGYACAACGREEGLRWTIANDHWIPITNPACPGTLPTNMVPLCQGTESCNQSKGNKDPLVWLHRRFGPRKAAAIRRKIEAYFALLRERG